MFKEFSFVKNCDLSVRLQSSSLLEGKQLMSENKLPQSD